MAHLRAGVKFIATAILAVIAWFRIKLSSRPSLIILTYHRILPQDHPDRKFEQPGMVTTPSALRDHIGIMRSIGAEPVHLDEWLARKRKGEQLPPLSVSFTFDDGWRDNFQFAYPVLKETRTPATIFLVTKLLDSDRTFWPEAVLHLLTSTGVPNGKAEFQWLIPFLPKRAISKAPLSLNEADQVINRLKELDDQAIISHLKLIEDSGLMPESPTSEKRSILSSTELKEMAAEGLVKFGAHTRHHYRLNRLNDLSALENEIRGCHNDLKLIKEGAVSIFCYPNGDITQQGEQLVQSCFDAACTTKTGWNRSDRNPYDLHRFNLHDGNSSNGRKLLATLGRGIV
ncbi:polysaccharide deacetylase family protein [Marinobacter sp. F4216]|uniref:polysaccharide deacetylase family protein n=1 Tax=Marinobacter sp. F4216 TaxID=2874281 RepID=UPI001CBBE5AF|nr:polysaccharide deacetylase family protein [Marinobacter sp. F4216]